MSSGKQTSKCLGSIVLLSYSWAIALPTASVCASPALGDRLLQTVMALNQDHTGPTHPGCHPGDSLPPRHYFYISVHEVLGNFYTKKTFISALSYKSSSWSLIFQRHQVSAVDHTENVKAMVPAFTELAIQSRVETKR